MTVDLDEFYQSMLIRLNQLKEERAEHGEILSFYARVLIAQQEAQGEIETARPDLPEDQLKLKLEEGFALIERENISVDRDCTERLFERLCHLSLEENPTLASAGKTLLEAMDSGRLEFASLTTAILENDTDGVENLGKELKVPPSILQVLTKMSLQPSLLAMAASVAERVPKDSWKQGYCPICGGLPAMGALVGEEGKRAALCSFCGHIWLLPRLGCPYCTTSNQQELRYFYGEGEDLYRVQVCDECQGYLKIMDTRQGGDVKTLAVDDVATAHLDLLAEQKGYQRKASRLLGV
jgi:FdhE protein